MEFEPKPSTPFNTHSASRIWSRSLLAVLAVAIFAALLHMFPFWRAQSQVQPGYFFTGNLSSSPDLMQYRAWERQALESGILVKNKFTSEPNEPHLLVIFYYLVGKFSQLFGTTPELIYAYIGAVFAFLFVFTLFVTVRQFFSSKNQVWWIFLVTLFGGGLGAYIMFLSNVNFVRNNFLLKKILVEGYWFGPPLFESYRGNYIINSIFDTHFILMWLLTTLSVLLFYLTLQKFSPLRLALTTFLFGLVTLIHVYDGITLGVIAFTIVLLLLKRKQAPKFVSLSLLILIGTILICLILFYMLYQSSGLPVPDWRGVNILFSILIISYPFAWLVIIPGIAKFWQNARFEESFLIGWALGCLILTLAGPYYPYPDRGTMTLQIPLNIIAGLILFRYFKRMPWQIGLAIIIVVGLTPAWVIQRRWENTEFNANIPSIWLSINHAEHIEKLKDIAGENDILITDMSKADWEVDPLWLAPDYPGKLFSAHFFLTVDFKNKREELLNFYDPRTTVEDQITFLSNEKIRFIYVDANQNPKRFNQIPGIKQVLSNPLGVLFEYNSK